GKLAVLPENTIGSAVLGSAMDMNLIYEAIYKRLMFYLTVGLAVVLAGAIVFWLTRKITPGYTQGHSYGT
ncbi:MAG: hypothetical protein GTO60_07465, partial [Gammaproteobacteria bacterium]|nr:hypothetical protein [Gammaproteobacteria bacterium]